MKTSVVIPAYNEEATIAEVLQRVLAVPVEKEVIVVDDGSTDRTAAIIEGFRSVTLVRLPGNRGKGAAIREGLKRATGDYVLIQDGDLELSPEEYPRLLEPVQAARSSVIYGSRFLRGRGRASWPNYLANRLITGWANLLYGVALTDVSTAYKLFPRSLVEQLDLQCQRFEFCAEITAKLLRMGFKIVEVPVTYTPRRIGRKKLNYLRDGLHAAWTLLRWRSWHPSSLPLVAPCARSTHPDA